MVYQCSGQEILTDFFLFFQKNVLKIKTQAIHHRVPGGSRHQRKMELDVLASEMTEEKD